MKKHVVMIVGEYYPSGAPAGVCAEKVISTVAEQYDIDVICTAGETEEEFFHHGKRVLPVTTGYFHLQRKLLSGDKKLLYRMVKLPVYFLDLLRKPNNLYWYKNKAYKKLIEINKENKVDIIFSVGGPLACHCAASRFKKEHPKTKWVSYLMDSYAAQNGNKKGAKRYEKRVISFADSIFLSEEIEGSCPFLKSGQEGKVFPLPYMIEQREKEAADKSILPLGKTNLVYAGRFYKKIRSPKTLLEMAKKMPEEFILHLYTTSDCDDMIKEAEAVSGGRICLHDMVDKDALTGIYKEADILVNVGNSVPEFAPSKTFEYIATGKPILNFYYENGGNALLFKHPLCLNILNGEEADKAAEKLTRFARDNVGKQVEEEKIKEIYFKHTPENIRKIVSAVFEE